MSQSGFPHSEIVGSKPVCGSPTLIAAYHVLHRLLVPRHSPYALSSLTYIFDFSLAEEIEYPHNTAYLRVLVRNYPLQDIQLSKSEKRVGRAGVGPPSPFGFGATPPAFAADGITNSLA